MIRLSLFLHTKYSPLSHSYLQLPILAPLNWDNEKHPAAVLNLPHIIHRETNGEFVGKGCLAQSNSQNKDVRQAACLCFVAYVPTCFTKPA